MCVAFPYYAELNLKKKNSKLNVTAAINANLVNRRTFLQFQFLSRYLGEGEFLPHDKIIQWLNKYGCELLTTEEKICENSIFVFSGFDEEQFNMVSYIHFLYRTLSVNI